MAIRITDWNDRYRPRCLEDCIVRPDIKAYLHEFEKTGTFPNLLFVGSPGTGKTTVARILCSLPQVTARVVNLVYGQPKDMSQALKWCLHFLYGGAIDDEFLEKVKKRRVVFIDESQLLKREHFEILKQWTESDHVEASFILALNDPKKLDHALRSRLIKLDFEPRLAEYESLMKQAAARCRNIAKLENLPLTDEELDSIVKQTFPDLRAMIYELYKLSVIRSSTVRGDTGEIS